MMGRGSESFNVSEGGETMTKKPETAVPQPVRRRFENLPPAAQRALKEAEARREEYARREAAMPAEIGGRGGKEPARYGDWEVNGIASDF